MLFLHALSNITDLCQYGNSLAVLVGVVVTRCCKTLFSPSGSGTGQLLTLTVSSVLEPWRTLIATLAGTSRWIQHVWLSAGTRADTVTSVPIEHKVCRAVLGDGTATAAGALVESLSSTTHRGCRTLTLTCGSVEDLWRPTLLYPGTLTFTGFRVELFPLFAGRNLPTHT